MKIVKILKSTVRRSIKSAQMLMHYKRYVNAPSYYPDVEHKSKCQIMRDQLFFLWRYGAVEEFYFLYGFERKAMTRKRMTTEYLTPYRTFQNRISQLNTINPKYGKFCARVITADKFYFSIFLKHFGFSTPDVYLYVKSKEIMYVAPQFGVDSTVSTKEQFRKFFSHDMDAFAKPSGGELGKGAFKLDVKDGKIYVDHKETSLDEIVGIFTAEDYLVQECVYQHHKMAELNPSCINSIRLLTVIDEDGVVHPLGAGLRVGIKGNSVDNWARGGLFVGVNMEKGTLMEKGFLRPEYGLTATEQPETHVVLKDFEIPFFKEAVDMAIQIHQHLYRCHSVGWDIAITETGPVFIEGNGLWEISAFQCVYGGMRQQIWKYFDKLKYESQSI